MESLLPEFPVWLWIASVCIAFAAGVVKGIVGFAFPLIMVSGLGTFVAPELALAGLILPTVVTNILQAFRLGMASAARAVGRFRWFVAVGGVSLILGAQMVPYVPQRVYLLLLGIPIVLFILSQLLGWRATNTKQSLRLDVGLGAIAGFFGGISGIWGPPTVSYLTALNTPKAIQMQVQGVIFLLGGVVLVGAHLVSGILTQQTLAFSALLSPPALAGMVLGTLVQDRIDQETFRRATLLVLLVAGLNLVRRGVML